VSDADPATKERAGDRRTRILILIAFALAAAGVCIFHLAPAVRLAPIAGLLPSSQLQDSRTRFAEGGNQVDPEISRLTRRVAQGAPLEAVPLYYHAVEQEGQASDAAILGLLDEVIRRDPRHYFARVWRARIYYRMGRMSDAVDEVLTVIPLNRSNEGDYLEALVDISRDPRNQSLMLGLVSEEPYWAQAFVKRAIAEIGDEDFSLALASRSRKSLNEYVGGLMRSGQYERAFLIWQATLTQAELMNMRWPVDPRFERIDDASPFGWQPNNAMTSHDGDGLHVFYNGRGAKPVLSQAMLLGAGYRYRFSARLSGEMKERGGWFRWRLICTQSRSLLMEVAVTSARSEDATTVAEFAVPDSECATQSIELSAEPGEYPFPARLNVREVRVDEVGPMEVVAAEAAPEEIARP